MPEQQTVWIARHASRRDFVDSDWYRTAPNPYDPPLSDEGVTQATQLGRRLCGENIARIFSSPFLRTVETAHQVADMLDLPVELEQGACEWLNADWFPARPEWTAPEALAMNFPRIIGRDASVVIPNYPETWEDLLTRTATAIRTLTAQTQADILIIGHGASLLGFTRALVRGEPEINADFCALVKLVRLNTRWQMELNGDTSFLSRPAGETRFI